MQINFNLWKRASAIQAVMWVQPLLAHSQAVVPFLGLDSHWPQKPGAGVHRFPPPVSPSHGCLMRSLGCCYYSYWPRKRFRSGSYFNCFLSQLWQIPCFTALPATFLAAKRDSAPSARVPFLAENVTVSLSSITFRILSFVLGPNSNLMCSGQNS